MDSSFNSPTTKPIYKGIQIIWYVLGLVEALLAFRFVFKLLVANPGAGFVSFVYSITQFLAAPFLSIFSQIKIAGVVFEWTTLIAMLVYLFVAWAIVKLLSISKTVSTPEAAERLNEKEDN
ncbi:MAG: YggT family protein [Candidatus Staskawiczbacteria bacterium]|nr:YggT family protein [Candidatus Staskawiczbacteria bacterium]